VEGIVTKIKKKTLENGPKGKKEKTWGGKKNDNLKGLSGEG